MLEDRRHYYFLPTQPVEIEMVELSRTSYDDDFVNVIQENPTLRDFYQMFKNLCQSIFDERRNIAAVLDMTGELR